MARTVPAGPVPRIPSTRLPLVLAAAAAALTLALPSPVEAQVEEHVWTADRPDGVAPPSVFGDRLLPAGGFEVTASFRRYDYTGTRFGDQLVGFDELLDFFQFVPVDATTETAVLTLGFGATEDLTVLARGAFVQKDRTQLFEEEGELFQFGSESSGIGDVEVHALYSVWEDGPYRAHVQGGVTIPVGSIDEEDDVAGLRTGVLPYDMQIGAGSFGLIPGATIAAQNEAGSVGLQALARIYLNENDRGYKPGSTVEASGWAAYRFNHVISVSSGFRAISWDAATGFDAELDPTRDPGEVEGFGGTRVDIPLGANAYLDLGPLRGSRVGVEFLWTVHEDFDLPWLALDDGFVVSLSLPF